MAFSIRTCLLLLVCILGMHKGNAHVIDALKTKEDVKQFLTSRFAAKGIDYPIWYYRIFQGAQFPLEYIPNYYAPDTIVVTDPETNKDIIKTVQRELNPDYYIRKDTDIYRYKVPFDTIQNRIAEFPYAFYKADIDGNGYTDLVVDAGIVIIVMDNGNTFDAYTFSASADYPSYSFKGFMPLPDGSNALLLRHDYNPSTSVEHAHLPTVTTYIIDTVRKNNTIRIDTIYKIATTVDSFEVTMGSCRGPIKKVTLKYADTVDMRLYNKIDTIVYKFNAFARYRKTYKPANITKLYYNYYHYMDANDFIEINKSGQCFMQYDSRYGNFIGKQDSKKLSDLWNLLSYIGIQSKYQFYNSEYASPHEADYRFIVHFDDGTVKDITSRGCGDTELYALSKMIAEISADIKWQPVKQLSNFDSMHHDLPSFSDGANCYICK